jgi:signal peptidase II
MKKTFIITTLILIIIDRAIKILIAHLLSFGSSISIINNIFNITLAKNYGAAWSILSGNRIFLITVAFISLGLIYWFFLKNKKLNKLEIYTYSFLIAGIIGNLIDRIYYGYVIDYLEFIINEYHFPIFNLADMMIVISIMIISYLTLKEGI